MILAMRTDKPMAELYLLKNSNGTVVASYTWQAHRELADTLLNKIDKLLLDNNLDLQDIKGVIIFTGEGSFTGLRIGTTVANTLGYALHIPVVVSEGVDWIDEGVKKLDNAKVGDIATPKYYAEPNITKPKQLKLEDSSN